MSRFSVLALLVLVPPMRAQENTVPSAEKSAAPAADGSIRLPVTRDTWFSNVGAEADGNNGGAERLKIKSHQEMSLVDIDAAPLRGLLIRSATLHLHSTGEPRAKRVTVSSFAAEWVEGRARGYTPEQGSSTFNHRKHPDVPWAEPGSDLCSVMLGAGGTIWRMADATGPDDAGWQRVAVAPAVVAARVAGVSHGFLIFDDTGSEWTRDGERFKIHLFPNRFLHSRESGPETAPYFTIVVGEKDDRPPEAPSALRADASEMPAGEAAVSWVTPRDTGPAGVIGFHVTANGKEVPRYLIPRAGAAGERVHMHLRDLGFSPGAEVALTIRAVDAAGNVGAGLDAAVKVADRRPIQLPASTLAPFNDSGALPTLGDAEVAVIDELDKVQPLTGAMIPPQPAGYLAANHLWSAGKRTVRLHAARNEMVGFQVLLRAPVRGLQAELSFSNDGGDDIASALGWLLHVKSKKGPLPDPIIPLRAPLDMAANTSLHCELFVPHRATAGVHRGRLTLRAGGQRLVLAVELHVWNFTLPDYLSFFPEMNCYGLPANEMDYYRHAHFHRTVINRVPYSQRGEVTPGCAPRYVGDNRYDWREWDRRFGPLLSGQAFADLPRKAVPIEAFYLPLQENWPTPMEGNYNGSYWADRAFPPRYRNGLVRVARQFTEHFAERGWNDTFFQFFLNGKNNFKERGWSRASSPWLLDEPANFQDFWALRWFGAAFHEGINAAPAGPRIGFRADISRPQWQRDALDGVLDFNVVGGAFRPYRRLVLDRKKALGEIVYEYGSTNAIEDSNLQPLGWCIDAWALGADGVVPWQTIGSMESWKEADPTALFYPGANDDGVLPSVRLKAYRRGQQDVEYLTLLTRQMRQPRWAVGAAVRESLKLAAEQRDGRSGAAEDAGVMTYDRLKPQQAWALRVQVGAALSAAAPKPERRLISYAPPRRNPSRLRDFYIGRPPAEAERQ